MRIKDWLLYSPLELKKRWARFKVLRNQQEYRMHDKATQLEGWLSVKDRELLIEILIERLMKK